MVPKEFRIHGLGAVNIYRRSHGSILLARSGKGVEEPKLDQIKDKYWYFFHQVLALKSSIADPSIYS